MNTLEVLPTRNRKRKESIMKDLDILRDIYQQKYGELAVGHQLLPFFQEAYDFKMLHWKPVDHFGEMFKLLEEQTGREYQFRKEAVRQYIRDSGLEENTQDIIDGMNRTAQRVTIWPDTRAMESGNPLRCWQVLQSDGKAMLEFALNYVDRWQWYNQLFGDTSK